MSLSSLTYNTIKILFVTVTKKKKETKDREDKLVTAWRCDEEKSTKTYLHVTSVCRDRVTTPTVDVVP